MHDKGLEERMHRATAQQQQAEQYNQLVYTAMENERKAEEAASQGRTHVAEQCRQVARHLRERADLMMRSPVERLRLELAQERKALADQRSWQRKLDDALTQRRREERKR